jgi:hypothetical protein
MRLRHVKSLWSCLCFGLLVEGCLPLVPPYAPLRLTDIHMRSQAHVQDRESVTQVDSHRLPQKTLLSWRTLREDVTSHRRIRYKVLTPLRIARDIWSPVVIPNRILRLNEEPAGLLCPPYLRSQEIFGGSGFVAAEDFSRSEFDVSTGYKYEDFADLLIVSKHTPISSYPTHHCPLNYSTNFIR